MKIKFTVSKRYNHFFFVQTLADWHFSCRPEYIEKWLKDIGPFTDREQESLSALKELLKETGFDPIEGCPAANAFDFFMRFGELKDNHYFSKEDVDVYLNAMASLENKFNKLWKVESKKLENIKKILSDRFNQTKVAVTDNLKTLFGGQINLDSEIEVLLLLSTEEGGGGANNGPNIITLECSSINPEEINYLLSTLWHEVTHLVLGEYIKKTASIMNRDDIIKEALIEAEKNDFDYSEELLSFSIFTPMSFLTGKHFHTGIAQKLSTSVSQEDTEWLLGARYVFVMYLVYLNGQFIKKMLDAKQSISPLAMANAIIKNHKKTKDFFLKNNKVPEWFDY